MSVSVSVSVSVQCSYSWCIIAKQKQMQENLLLAHHDLVTRANQVAANLPMRSMRNGFSCDHDWGASPFQGKFVWTLGSSPEECILSFWYFTLLYVLIGC